MHYHMQAKDAKNYDIKLKDIAQLVVEGQSVLKKRNYKPAQANIVGNLDKGKNI